ncbi:hypothetical protein [Kurthia gibsonii]|uniref:hypothetical protein n=1 Tax=Kurthia gibsonii TaxID=33946 RepID=UPI002DBC5EBE|nr:hypothetical protein [Kurthia gibsonii]MEB7773552.1 hypothetical protein [Kurthia gibsonii]
MHKKKILLIMLPVLFVIVIFVIFIFQQKSNHIKLQKETSAKEIAQVFLSNSKNEEDQQKSIDYIENHLTDNAEEIELSINHTEDIETEISDTQTFSILLAAIKNEDYNIFTSILSLETIKKYLNNGKEIKYNQEQFEKLLQDFKGDRVIDTISVVDLHNDVYKVQIVFTDKSVGKETKVVMKRVEGEKGVFYKLLVLDPFELLS